MKRAEESKLKSDYPQENSLSKSLKIFAKTSFIIFFGLVISKISTYFYRVIIARNFGPETYGLFSLAIMVSFWFISISPFGLNEGLFRFIGILNEKTSLDIFHKIWPEWFQNPCC